ATGYVVRRFNPDGSIQDYELESAAARSFDVGGLSAALRYGFQVLARDAGFALSVPSATVYASPAGEPTRGEYVASSVRARAVAIDAIRVTWSPPTDFDPVAVAGWDVLRATSAGGPFASILPDNQIVDALDVGYEDEGVAPGQQYWYKVVAVDDQGVQYTPSAAVEARAGVPAAPTGLVAGYAGAYAEGDRLVKRVGLRWSAVPSGVALLGYDVYRGTTPDFSLSPTNLIGTSATARYTDDIDVTGQPTGHTYYYAVRAVYAGYDGAETSSAPSARVAVPTGADPMTKPAAPSNLAAVEVTSARVTLAWTDQALDEAGFDVFRREHDALAPQPWGTPIGRLTADATTFVDETVDAGVAYEYEVRPHNKAGRRGDIGGTGDAVPSVVVTVSASPAAPPAAPTGLSFSSRTTDRIALTWTGPAGSPAATGYHVYRKTAEGGFVRLTANPIAATTLTDGGLRAGTTYTYRVVALSAGGGRSQALQGDLATLTAPDVRPSVRIVSPGDFSGIQLDPLRGNTVDTRIRKVTTVAVIVDDPNFLGNGDPADAARSPRWELRLVRLGTDGSAAPGQGEGVLLAAGHGSVGSPAGATGGSVYQLDPSQFPDGQYRLSLRARDEKGAGAPAAVTVSLFSNNKFGNLVLPTTDLQFDIPGRSPLVVRRVYDSSRANERLDFGYGWRLEATQSLVQTTARRDASTGGSVFREGDLVYVDVPGQGRHVFQFLPVPNNYGATNPSPYFGYTNYWAQFVAVDGSNATLSVPGDINAPESARLDLIRNPDGGGYVALGLDLKSSGTYDPASIKFGNEYVVKSADGTRHSIRASTGRLQRSTDANGNVTTGGVDAGTFSVEFDRLAWTNGAAAGLIGAVRIVDKAGNQVGEQFNYAYDEVKGNLISTTYDGRTTRYRYADPAAGREHFLTSVVDPRNVVMLRAAYDDAGRLASLTDATGKAVSVGTTTSDGATGGEAVVDPTADANQTENIYDDHGNVIRQIRTVRSGGVLTGYHVTVFAYDYHAGDLTSELSELFDADALSAARSQQNALVAMREYAPFTVPAADRDQRYTRAPGRVQRETTFHGANGGLAAKLPHKQIEQPDDNTRRVTTFSEYSPLGKPGRVTSELFKTVPDGDDEDALPDWVAVTTMIARSLYDTSGNLRFQIDEDGAGTEYIYTLNQPGLPNGLLTHTYRVTGLPKADEALTGIPAVNTYTRVRLSATAYFTTTNATTGAFAGQVHWTEGAENSRTTFYWYDDRGRVIRTYFAAEEGGQDVWVSSETLYDGERIRDTFEQWYVDDGDHVLDLADQGGDSAIFTSSTPPHSTTTFYDALGRVKEVSSFEGTTTNTYDIDGNLIQVAHPDGTYTRTVYDDMGRVVWQTDRFRSILSSRPAGLTNATRTLYDALGRAVRTERYTNVHVDFVAEDRPVAVDGGTVSDLMRTKLGSVAALAAELNQEHLDPDPPLVLPPTVLLAAEETVYDGAGRVVETARLLGTATHPYLRAGTVYDDAGRVLHAGVLRITAPAAAARGFVFTTGDFESFTTYAPDRAGGVTPGSGIVNRVTTGQVNNAGGRVNETRTDARGRAWRTYFDDDTNPLDSTDDRSFTEVLYGVGDQEHGTYALPPRQDGEEASVPAGGRHEVRLAQRRPGETPAVTHYVYDALGRLTDVWLPPVDDASTTPTTPVAPHWHYVYDADGNQTEQTDPNGHTTEFGYDSRGRRVSRTLPGNQTETWQYDFRGRLRVHVDFKGQATFYDFDDTARGRLRGEYRYATAGAVPATGDPASVPWDERSMYEYDDDGAGLGRIVKVTTWDRHPVSGDPRKVQWEQTAFDPITGNVVRETVRRPGADPNLPDTLSDVRHVYDAGTGLLVETSTFVTDGNAVETISSRTLYGYDRQGRLASVTSAKVAGQTPAAPAVRRARYGPAGQIAAGAAGNALPTTTYQYDPAGNLWKVNLPNGVVTTYAYDRVGRLTGVVTVDMEGDKLFEQNYELESDGQRDLVVEKRYDGANATPFSTVTVDWAYDAAGRLTGETRDGGTTMTASTPNNAGDYVDTYGYDLNGNRRTKSHVFHTGSAVQTDRTAYAYDTAGNDRLVAEGPDVEPDGIPDVATRTTYAYDANGSTTSKTTGSDVTKYLYDLRNKLVGLSANDDTDATDSGDTQYVYDASGNRIERVEHGASSDTTTIFVNDTANPIGHAQVVEERSSATAATPTVTYVVGGDVLGQARAATAISGAAPALEYLLYDGHGSTRGLLSAAGAIATGVAASDQVYDYDAFGIALSSNPASVLTTLLYSGEQLDSGLGMQYLRSRFYNQAVGRFFSFDSFQANPQDPSKLHKYAYVANDPIGMIDPSGYVGIVDTLVTKALRTIFVVGPIVAGANYFVRKLLAPSKLNTPVARITAPPAWATATSQMSNADADLADSVDPLVNCQDWALNASINFGFPYVSWPTAAMGRNGWKSVIGDPAQFGAGLDAYFTGSGTGYRVNLGHTPPPGWHNIAVYSRYNFYKDSNSDSAFFDRGTYDFHYATQDSVGEWTSKENTDPVRYIPGPHHLDRNEWWGWSTLVGLWCVKGPPRTHIPNLLLEK
ncbi:MAG TPA: fibronectin type III domain-containing protein, partial [Tepidisphaeraceae bacterium]|nr:fibronectin type III domain-containing protein [Tepidisphaeraceae bacterium]